MTHGETDAGRRSRLSCIENNNAWRRQAQAVRDHAATTKDETTHAGLERSAASCDEQATWWLDGAIGDQVASR